MRQTEKFGRETLKSVWISGCYPAITLRLEKTLEAKTRVYRGRRPPANESPSSIIFCPSGEDIASEVRYLRDLAQDATILVLGFCVDTQLARTALLAGAHGFIHLGMRPPQIVHTISKTSKDEAVVSRDLLEAFLEGVISREISPVLTPRQREFLELVAVSTPLDGEIVVPRELLEAFLSEAEMA